jgi:hypothetical protein
MLSKLLFSRMAGNIETRRWAARMRAAPLAFFAILFSASGLECHPLLTDPRRTSPRYSYYQTASPSQLAPQGQASEVEPSFCLPLVTK